jgi:hypothetical protein
MMDGETAALVLQVLRARAVHHAGPDRRRARAEPALSRPGAPGAPLGVRVIDRCNLTILSEPGQEDLAAFLAEQEVEVVASLPCYSVANVDRQRGRRRVRPQHRRPAPLNALGYGQPGSGRVLNLVYNPQGAVLPPPQGPLQADYKRELASHFGIVFNQLYALTNMPIQRFGSTLVSKGTFPGLPAIAQGRLPAAQPGHRDVPQPAQRGLAGPPVRLRLQPDAGPAGARGQPGPAAPARPAGGDAQGSRIRVADHCYGCTAGQGSSCGGALEAEPASAPSTRKRLPALRRPEHRGRHLAATAA